MNTRRFSTRNQSIFELRIKTIVCITSSGLAAATYRVQAGQGVAAVVHATVVHDDGGVVVGPRLLRLMLEAVELKMNGHFLRVLNKCHFGSGESSPTHREKLEAKTLSREFHERIMIIIMHRTAWHVQLFISNWCCRDVRRNYMLP